MPVANVKSKWSAGNLVFYESVAGNGASVQFGEDGSGMDMIFRGTTASNYMQWDESADSLLLVGTAVKFSLGSFTGAAIGTGSVVSSSATAPFKVFADDGGAAIGSGSLVRAGWFRNLQTYTGGNREQEATGVQGSLVSVAGVNRHNMSGVLGSYEARTSLTVGGQAATTDTWIQAGVLGRVGMSTGTLVVDTNAVLAGVAAMSNINSAVNETLTGDYVGFYVGAWANAIDFEIGLLIEGSKVTQGINVGKHSSTAVGPAVIISATNTAANRFYADDGGASIAIAASVPDVKNTLFRTLITKDNSAYNGRVHSLMGQLKSVDGEWGDEQWSAVHGYLELVQSSGTITLQSYGVTAGVMATVETQGTFGVVVTHNLAGFAAISKLGYTGTFTDNTNTSGLYVGIYDSTNWSDSPTLDKWNHGLYVQAAAADKGIQIGEMSSTTQIGLTLVSGSGYEAVSVYSDDGNATLTGGTPFAGIHTRTMLFKDQDEGTTLIGAWGQLKYYSGVDIGPARVAAVEGYNELLTTNLVKSGGEMTCVNAVIDVVAGVFTVNSGGIATGFHAKLTGAGEIVQDSTGILAGLKIDEGITTGNWGYGIYSPSAAVNVGAYLRPTVKGMDISVSTVPSAGYGNSWKAYQASAKSAGLAGYFEGHMTGTSTGPTYALGAWMNVDSGTHGSHIYGLDVGVYAADAAYAGGVIVAANFFTYVSNNTSGPTVHAMFRFNTDISEDVPDYWFMAANPQSIALVDNADVAGTKIAAIAIQVSGSLADPGYIWVYDSTGA